MVDKVTTVRELIIRGKGEGLTDLAAAIRAAESATNGMVAAGGALKNAAAGLGPKLVDAGSALDTYRKRMEPGYRATQQFVKDMTTLARAFDQSKLGPAEFAIEVDRLKASLQAAGNLSKSTDLGTTHREAAKAARDSAAAFEEARTELRKLADAQAYYADQRAKAAAAGPTSAAAINARLGVGSSGTSAEASGAAIQKQLLEQERKQLEAQAYYAQQASQRAAAGPTSAGAVNARLGVGAAPAADASASASAFEAAFAAEEKMIDGAMRAKAALDAAHEAAQEEWFNRRDLAQLAEFNREQEQMAREANALKAAVDPMGHAFDTLGAKVARYNELLNSGAINQKTFRLGLAEAQRVFEHVDRTYGGDKGANASKLAATQFTNLGYQLNDVVSGLAMGQSPMTILTQQGGQVYQALASARGGVAGGLSAVKEQVGGFLSGMSATTGILGGVSLAALAAAVSFNRLSSSQRDVKMALAGAGRATGATAGGVENIAMSQNAVSPQEARSMSAEFARTGRIGMDMYAGLIKATKEYANATNSDLADAQKVMAGAFADPAKGAGELNKVLGGLDDTTEQLIIHLQASGDRAGAQRVMFGAFAKTLSDTNENLTVMQRLLDATGNAFSTFADRVGKGVANAFQGGDTLEAQLETAQKILANAQARRGGTYGAIAGLFGSRDSEVDSAQKSVSDLLAKLDDKKMAAFAAAAAQTSREIGAISRAASPSQEELKKLTTEYNNLKRATEDPIKAGLFGDALTTANSLVDTYARRIANLADDITRFGTAAQAALMRASQESSRTVGFSPQAQSVAAVNARAAEEARNADSRELAAIEARRRLDVETAQRTYQNTAVNQGGAFSRMSPDVQQRILSSQEKLAPSLTPDLIAAIFEKESGGNLNIGLHGTKSSAYGIGGMTVGAETDVRKVMSGFDRTDPSQAIEGAMKYLQMRVDRAGGDVFKGISGYGEGPAYAADVLRKSGAGGAQSTLAVSQQFDENSRAVKEANAAVDINSRLLGVNGERLDAATKARQLLADAEAKGIPLTDQYRKMLEDTAAGLARAARSMASIKFDKDLSFDYSQLGRNAQEQSAYAKIRGQFGDVNSPEAQAALQAQQSFDQIKMYRDLGSSMFQGIGQDLLNATSAADALHNAFNKMASKMMDMALDNIWSKMFAGIMGQAGGGSGGGLLSGLFGGGGAANSNSQIISGVSWSANGNVMTSRGPMPLNMYSGGGIANKPQMSIFGEGRTPEAYVPLPDGRSIPVSMRMDGASGGGGAGAAPTMNAQTIVHNYGNDNVRSRTTQTPQGPRTEIVIGEMIDQHMRSPEFAPMARKMGINRMANGR